MKKFNRIILSWHTFEADQCRLCLTEENTNQIVDIAICHATEDSISDALVHLSEHYSFTYPCDIDTGALLMSEYIALEVQLMIEDRKEAV